MQTLEAQCPRVERYSIDEAFVEIPGKKQTEREAFARQLPGSCPARYWYPRFDWVGPNEGTGQVGQSTGQTTQGSCRDLVYARRSGNPSTAAFSNPLTDVWGIGKRWARRLEIEGWQNAADLAAADPAMIRLVANVVLQRIAGTTWRVLSLLGRNSPLPRSWCVVVPLVDRCTG